MFYFRIRIVATDAGSPPMSSECEVSVTVVGGNEYAPKFDEDEANAERRVAIPAGLGPDTLVYSLSATDADSQKLRFAFSSENISDYFRIDSETGKIFTSQSLIDLQPASTLVLEVTVYDGGIPNRTDTTQVAFLVTADNLHAPEFQSPATRIYIREDEQVSQELLHSIFAFNNVVWKCIPNCSLFLFSLVKISFNTLKIIQLIQKNFRLLLFYNFLKFIEFVSDRQHHRHAEGERRRRGHQRSSRVRNRHGRPGNNNFNTFLFFLFGTIQQIIFYNCMLLMSGNNSSATFS